MAYLTKLWNKLHPKSKFQKTGLRLENTSLADLQKIVEATLNYYNRKFYPDYKEMKNRYFAMISIDFSIYIYRHNSCTLVDELKYGDLLKSMESGAMYAYKFIIKKLI